MAAVLIAPCVFCGGVVAPKSPQKHGRQSRFCSIQCRKAYRRNYRRQWLSTNRVRIAEYRDMNRDQVRAWNRDFYARHKNRRKQQRVDRYRENPAKSLEASRRYDLANHDRVRAIGRKSRQTRRARLLSVFVEVVDPHVVFVRDKGVCGICMKPVHHDTDWHIDHVIPLAKGGAHSYANSQLAHGACNRAKGARVLVVV